MIRPVRCNACGGLLYHEAGCELDCEAIVIEAMHAVRWAYAGIPLHPICPCELGYPGVLSCRHSGIARRCLGAPLRRIANQGFQY